MKNPKRDFDKEAANWDQNPTRVKLAGDVADAILREVPVTPDMDVLDFGCGTGLVSLRLAPLVKSVIGADTSRGMLEVLQSKARSQGHTNVHVRHLGADHRSTGAYDLIVSSMTFHHVEHTAAQLKQLFASLKTPGRLCIADLDPDGGAFHDDNTGVFHFGFERAALCDLFQQTGFSAARATTATEVVKPGRNGALRTFSIFLIVGEKT